MPCCSARAAQLLDWLLNASDTPATQRVLAEWFTHAAAAHRRVPHRLLPRVLDYAARHRALRPVMSPCLDARGEWLVSLNPHWQFTASESETIEEIWQTGNSEQRLVAVRRLRRTDPRRAVELINSTWKEDAADDRTAFIESLSVGLSDADETFLEAALDDKSKNVRAAAAELLVALPGSAFVKRMIERAESLVRYVPAESGSMLKMKRAKRAVIEVTLPAEKFDKALTRDGIVEKPLDRIGQRQWWLLQIISYVPPVEWAKRWNVTPKQAIEALDEYKDIILRGWKLAAKRAADQQWLSALLLRSLDIKDDRFDPELAKVLRPELQLQIIDASLTEESADLHRISEVLGATEAELDARIAMKVVQQIDRYMKSRTTGYDYYLSPLLTLLAPRIPPQMYEELAARWVGEKWEPNQKSLEPFLYLLAVRRDIKKEFS